MPNEQKQAISEMRILMLSNSWCAGVTVVTINQLNEIKI
jgi:hypothetical protein